jgi:hypothetical protein
MGYFYNHLESRWDPIDHGRKLSPAQAQEIERRKLLIADLITEIESSGSDSAIKLYAGLLARALTATDELLLRAYSEQLAKLHPGPAPKLKIYRATTRRADP